MFVFHSLLSQLLSSTFYPFLFITEVLAMPAHELSFGQWQVHHGSGWRNDCLTWAHPLLPSSTSPPCIPQSLATQNHYISKAEVSAVLKSMFSFCVHCLCTMNMFYLNTYFICSNYSNKTLDPPSIYHTIYNTYLCILEHQFLLFLQQLQL